MSNGSHSGFVYGALVSVVPTERIERFNALHTQATKLCGSIQDRNPWVGCWVACDDSYLAAMYGCKHTDRTAIPFENLTETLREDIARAAQAFQDFRLYSEAYGLKIDAGALLFVTDDD